MHQAVNEATFAGVMDVVLGHMEGSLHQVAALIAALQRYPPAGKPIT